MLMVFMAGSICSLEVLLTVCQEVLLEDVFLMETLLQVLVQCEVDVVLVSVHVVNDFVCCSPTVIGKFHFVCENFEGGVSMNLEAVSQKGLNGAIHFRQHDFLLLELLCSDGEFRRKVLASRIKSTWQCGHHGA